MKFCIFCNDNKKRNSKKKKMTQLFNHEKILVHLAWLFTFKIKKLVLEFKYSTVCYFKFFKKHEGREKEPTIYTFGSDSPQFKLPSRKLAAYLRTPKSQDAVLNTLNYELCSTLPQPQAQRTMNSILS